MHYRWVSKHALQGEVPGPGGGGLLWGVCLGGAWSWGVPGPREGVPAPGEGGCLVETPRTATAEGGTHPTGMHSR